MGRLYSVALISKSQMRDLSLELLLNDGIFNKDNYIHDGDFDYVFDVGNILNTDISRYSIVYKTLNGAKKFRDRFRSDSVMRLRYSIKDPNGSWIRSCKTDHIPVVIDITDKWDNIIDNRISLLTNKFNEDLEKLKSKKSKK